MPDAYLLGAALIFVAVTLASKALSQTHASAGQHDVRGLVWAAIGCASASVLMLTATIIPAVLTNDPTQVPTCVGVNC
jgi:hypothetical protein